jgi:hypothetical protein
MSADLINQSPYQFSYDVTSDFKINFITWFQLNTEERSAYQEKPYNPVEGLEVFREMYGNYEEK